MKVVHLRNALQNAAPDSGATDEYVRGLIVGVVSGLLARGMRFDAALALVRQNMPTNARNNVFPESWV